MDSLVSKKFLIQTILIAVCYLLLVIYLMNINLMKDTLFGNYPLGYRISISIALLGGMWTAMSHLALAILVTTAFLTGVNLTLIIQKISLLRAAPKVQLVLGSSILGVISSGCVACGLPIISFLGLTGSLVFLPFHGSELSVVALVLLIISSYFLLNENNKYRVCAINR